MRGEKYHYHHQIVGLLCVSLPIRCEWMCYILYVCASMRVKKVCAHVCVCMCVRSCVRVCECVCVRVHVCVCGGGGRDFWLNIMFWKRARTKHFNQDEKWTQCRRKWYQSCGTLTSTKNVENCKSSLVVVCAYASRMLPVVITVVFLVLVIYSSELVLFVKSCHIWSKLNDFVRKFSGLYPVESTVCKPALKASSKSRVMVTSNSV